MIELAGIGPGPHCCMMLADMGEPPPAPRPKAPARPGDVAKTPCSHKLLVWLWLPQVPR